MDRNSYAIVLSGGGAKGAYEIGVWKALREEGIKLTAYAGTSVGALNAGIIANGDFKKAEEIWSHISLSDIVCMPQELIKKGNLIYNPKNIRKFIHYIIKNKGLVTRPLYRLIRGNINEARIRKTVSDLGIVTYSLTDMKPFHLFLDQIPEGQLPRFLLASAAMPIFRAVNINGRVFTDGGVADNLPFRMMKQRGYRKIIAVDMSAVGISRKPEIEGSQCIYIKNSIPLGDELDFRQSELQRSINLGYLDTRKVFSHYSGTWYFLTQLEKTDEQICSKLVAFFRENNLEKKLEKSNCISSSPLNKLRCFLPQDLRLNRYPGISFLECAARSLNVNREIPYTAENLVKAVRARYRDTKENQELKKLGFFTTRKIKIKRKQNEENVTERIDYKTMALALDREKEYMLSPAVRSLFPYAQAGRLFIYSFFSF